MSQIGKGLLEMLGIDKNKEIVMTKEGWKELERSCYDVRRRIVIKETNRQVKIDSKIISDEEKVDIEHSYETSGIILSPFTCYERIYIVPVGFRYIFRDKDFFMIKPKKIYTELDITKLLAKCIKEELSFKGLQKRDILLSGGADSSLLILKSLTTENSKIERAILYINNMIARDRGRALRLSKIAKCQIVEYKGKIKTKDDILGANYKLMKAGRGIMQDIAVLNLIELEENLKFNEIIIDGQGADTVFGGLPHQWMYMLWNSWVVTLMRRLGILKVSQAIVKKFGNRKIKNIERLIKLIKCLDKQIFYDALMESLGIDSNQKNSRMEVNRQIYHIYENATSGFGAITIQFLCILSEREMQKYALFNNKEFILPYLQPKLVEHMLTVDEKVLCSIISRKKPIVEELNRIFPAGKYNGHQGMPFEAILSEGRGEAALKQVWCTIRKTITDDE